MVDSTRKGRSLPDSFSRTVPMWCAVINRLAQRLDSVNQQWDNGRLHCPGSIVSPQEQCLMEELLDKRVCCNLNQRASFPPTFTHFNHSQQVEAILSSKIDLDLLKIFLQRPLRAAWITTKTYLEKPDDHPLSDVDIGLDSGDWDKFNIIVCVCASVPVDTEHRSTYTYVQGAGDDEETWSLGLTPQMFWANKTDILSGDPTTCPSRVIDIVSRHTDSDTDCISRLLLDKAAVSERVWLQQIGKSVGTYLPKKM